MLHEPEGRAVGTLRLVGHARDDDTDEAGTLNATEIRDVATTEPSAARRPPFWHGVAVGFRFRVVARPVPKVRYAESASASAAGGSRGRPSVLPWVGCSTNPLPHAGSTTVHSYNLTTHNQLCGVLTSQVSTGRQC